MTWPNKMIFLSYGLMLACSLVDTYLARRKQDQIRFRASLSMGIGAALMLLGRLGVFVVHVPAGSPSVVLEWASVFLAFLGTGAILYGFTQLRAAASAKHR